METSKRDDVAEDQGESQRLPALRVIRIAAGSVKNAPPSKQKTSREKQRPIPRSLGESEQPESGKTSSTAPGGDGGKAIQWNIPE
ncbi:hypothetical protein MJ561_24125 [Klebsiella pneumoniae]|nr:hypothetical protein MJ561_24125 [Klebsiella pneumoniae]